MKKTGVILLGFLPNPRFEKRIALEKELCDLHVICWDRCQDMMKLPETKGYTIHCLKIKAENDPLKRLMPYRQFVKQTKNIIKKLNPAFIHVQGLDMLRIACYIRKSSKKNVSVIYEVADLHRLLIDKQKRTINKLAQQYMRKAEMNYCKSIDLLIVTSEEYYNTYFYRFVSKEKTLYFPNVPNFSAFKTYKKKEKSSDNFTIGFIGAVRYKKQMENLIIAAKKCNIHLLIAGYEIQPPEIEVLCKMYENGEWAGNFNFEKQIAELYGRCDVMYSVYDADMTNVRVALPNKLYEAIFCEMPLIVAKHTYLAQIVEEWRIGVAVDHKGPEELITAIKKLSSEEDYYLELCENCKAHKDVINAEKSFYRLQTKIKAFLG